MNIYIVRHGQTGNNFKNIFNGRFDEDINETGIEQAKKARELIKDISFDKVYCSPLLRTRHTASIITEDKYPLIIDERIIERECGELTHAPVDSVDREKYWNYYDEECYEKYPHLEKISSIFDRVFDFIEDLKKDIESKNVLVVTHSGVARSFWVYFNGLPEDGSLLIPTKQSNCEIKKYII